MTVTVKSATAADILTIMEVMDAAFDPAFGEAWTEQQLAGVLVMPGTTLAAAYLDGLMVGFALWRLVLDEAELLLIGVHSLNQLSGVGTALLDYAVTECAYSGAKSLHVEVRVDNDALYFYVKSGFEQVGIRPDYYRRKDNGPRDAATLCLNLAP
jgi:[ribosomal protein S18]-alanine N-acetyltransferase